MENDTRNEFTVSGQTSDITAPHGLVHPEPTVTGNGVSAHQGGTAVGDRHPVTSEISEVDFAELVDGSLVEMIEDPKIPRCPPWRSAQVKQ